MMNSGSNFGELGARAIKSAGKWTSWRVREARNSNRFLLIPPIFGDYGDLLSDCGDFEIRPFYISMRLSISVGIPFRTLRIVSF